MTQEIQARYKNYLEAQMAIHELSQDGCLLAHQDKKNALVAGRFIALGSLVGLIIGGAVGVLDWFGLLPLFPAHTYLLGYNLLRSFLNTSTALTLSWALSLSIPMAVLVGLCNFIFSSLYKEEVSIKIPIKSELKQKAKEILLSYHAIELR